MVDVFETFFRKYSNCYFLFLVGGCPYFLVSKNLFKVNTGDTNKAPMEFVIATFLLALVSFYCILVLVSFRLVLFKVNNKDNVHEHCLSVLIFLR